MNRELPQQQTIMPPPPPGFTPHMPISQPTYGAPSPSTFPSIDTTSLQSGNPIDFSLFSQELTSSTNRSASASTAASLIPPILNSTPSQLSQPSGVTNPSPSIANLFNSLLQAGVVSAPPAISTSFSSNAKDAELKSVQSHEEMEYDNSLLSMTITLTSSDITKFVIS